MAWLKTGLDKQMAAFEKLPNSKGNMPGPASTLHHKTMLPALKGNSAGFGNPTAGALGGPVKQSVQSPAQHAATVKAGVASGLKRKKTF